MAVPLVQLGAIFLGSAWAYKEGYVTKFMDKLNKNDDNNGQSSSNLIQRQQHQQQQQPLIIQQQIPQSNNNKLLPFLGISSLIAIGYIYYNNTLGTKKVINKVDKTSKQTQSIVKKSDENNAKRFIQLDKRNTKRNNDMELHIRSETKAGFKVVTEQLYCLTQVCIQTLGAIANGSTNNDNNGEFYGNNEKLLGYADKAQEMADTILSEKHLNEVKNKNLSEMKAEIYERNNEQLIEYTKNTPGLLNNNNKNTSGNNDNDIYNNNSNITTYNNMEFDNDNNNNNNDNINNDNNILNYFKFGTIKNIVKKHIINQIFNNNNNNDDDNDNINDENNNISNLKNIKVIAGSVTIVGVFALWKYWPSNNNKNNQYQYQYQYQNTNQNNQQ